MEPLSKVLEFLKLSTTALLTLALAAAFIVLMPDAWASALGLDRLRDNYGAWVSGVMVVSGALVGARGIVGAVASCVRRRRIEDRRRRAKKLLRHDLDPHTRAELRGYLVDRTRTKFFEPHQGFLDVLQRMDILYRAANVSAPGGAFPYNLTDWAWDFLRANPEILDEEEPPRP